MDDALITLEYLPQSFKNENGQEYVDFLWDAFRSNYEGGRYQFAMLAFHMLYMSFVYSCVWKIKLGRPDDFAKAILFQQNEKENKFLGATSPFIFSLMLETEIFNFLRLIDGCEKMHTGQYAMLVKERNGIAHSNGSIAFNYQAQADEKIAKTIEHIIAIQSHMQPVIHDCLKQFLMGNWNAEEREYFEAEDQIREAFVGRHYFSQKEIETCLAFDLDTLSGKENFSEMTELFRTFTDLYHSDEE